MMALDCSLGKQFFLTWRKDIFKVFCIYIYIYIYQTLPFDGYLFIYFILFYFIYFFYFYLFIFFL